MIPDLELQLSVTIKALRDVVLPAIDPADGVAIEQAHLALATLGMVRAHLPLRQNLAQTELSNALARADSLDTGATAETALATARSKAKAVAGNPASCQDEMEAARLSLLEEMERLIADVPAHRFAALGRSCLAAMQPQLDLQRRWVADAGFDPDATGLPAIEKMLSQSPANAKGTPVSR